MTAHDGNHEPSGTLHPIEHHGGQESPGTSYCTLQCGTDQQSDNSDASSRQVGNRLLMAGTTRSQFSPATCEEGKCFPHRQPGQRELLCAPACNLFFLCGKNSSCRHYIRQVAWNERSHSLLPSSSSQIHCLESHITARQHSSHYSASTLITLSAST